MPKNLEIKAVCSSILAAKGAARRIGARYAGTMLQVDTYFLVRSGRLKLREIDGKRSELIFYQRANRRGSRYSDYRVIPLKNVATAKRVFRTVLGQKIVVRKKRMLFEFKNARIHIDRIRGLGSFIEFEVLVQHGARQAQRLMSLLINAFRLRPVDIIGYSYSDMLLRMK
jgi:predicted adenylyl cyclase CyaB